MISLITKAVLNKNNVITIKLPDDIKLVKGKYEIVVVINTTSDKDIQKKELTFSDHDFVFANFETTLSRTEIYGESGR